MKELWSVYHKEIPPFLQEFAAALPVQRLKDVGMNCGCEYTNFPRFADIGPYSRYDHSLGVALIVWHFKGDMAQSLAGLFHDVTTPVFAHVVDFLNGDHERQESTEAGVEACLSASAKIMELLEQYAIPLEAVTDYHRYPIADNDSPALSADRLEYTLGNLLNYRFADFETVCRFYEDLTVGKDEQGRPELVFRSVEIASAFTAAALKNAHVYVADEDRYAMQMLADLLRIALQRGTLQYEDLHTTEPQVLEKLKQDEVCLSLWRQFCGLSRILRREDSAAEGEEGWLCVPAKKRWIDPISQEYGRVSQYDANISHRIDEFCALDFSCWLKGE